MKEYKSNRHVDCAVFQSEPSASLYETLIKCKEYILESKKTTDSIQVFIDGNAIFQSYLISQVGMSGSDLKVPWSWIDKPEETNLKVQDFYDEVCKYFYPKENGVPPCQDGPVPIELILFLDGPVSEFKLPEKISRCKSQIEIHFKHLLTGKSLNGQLGKIKDQLKDLQDQLENPELMSKKLENPELMPKTKKVSLL